MRLDHLRLMLDHAGRARRRYACDARRSLWAIALGIASLGTAAVTPHASTGALADTVIAGQAAAASPRSALAGFLESCRRGNYAVAATYLDMPPPDAAQGPERARQLKAVLDRHAWFDLSTISPLPGGDTDDGLSAASEEIARIPRAGGADEPVRMVRRPDHGGGWIFSRATVNRVPYWYAHLGKRWLLERIPVGLLKPGPQELTYWQWLALPIVLLVAWVLGLVLSRMTRRALVRIASKTRTGWDDDLLVRMGGPISLAWALVAAYALVPWLGLYAPAEDFVHRALRGGVLVTVFWALLRSIDVAHHVVVGSPWAREHSALGSLIPLAARIGKVAVFASAVVTLLAEFGFAVTSLLAGLGIGGLALALAAQKTMENLFGAFAIGTDQPFRQGDFVSVEDFVGTVETIGLRATRFRTLDRTLISIPNGRLADMRLESLTARDRMRLACTVGLVYSTTANQMRTVLTHLERILRDHPSIWPDAVVVRFKEFGDSSLNIEVMAWFQTREWSEFQLIRQDVLLQFMEVVEQAGSSFAFPTQTVHVVSESHR